MMRRQSGFTIIEVLVAMLILAGGILVVANSWSGNYNRLQKSRINNTMAALLQRKMTDMEILYKDKPVEQIKEEDGGTFEDYKNFSWSMKSQEFEMPDLSSALIAKNEGTDEQTLMVVRQVTEYIRKVVKEVTVSVTYTSPKSKQKIVHEATTYFIDYKKEVPMAGAMGGGGAPPPATDGSGGG